MSQKDAGKHFTQFVTKLRGQAQGKFLQKGYVPASTYWLVVRNTYVAVLIFATV